MKKENSKIHKKIKEILEITPGVVQLSFVVPEEKDTQIMINEEQNNLDISLGIIISKDIVAQTLSKELYELINFYIKNQTNFKLRKLNVYINGVK